MKLDYTAILDFILVLLSLSPFVGVGYYFGTLEKRVTANTVDISKLKKHIGVYNE